MSVQAAAVPHGQRIPEFRQSLGNRRHRNRSRHYLKRHHLRQIPGQNPAARVPGQTARKLNFTTVQLAAVQWHPEIRLRVRPSLGRGHKDPNRKRTTTMTMTTIVVTNRLPMTRGIPFRHGRRRIHTHRQRIRRRLVVQRRRAVVACVLPESDF